MIAARVVTRSGEAAFSRPHTHKPTMAEQPEMPEMPKMSPKMFIAPLGMLTIKFFKIDVTMYLQELRVAFGVVTALNFLCLYFLYMKIQVRARGSGAPISVVVVHAHGSALARAQAKQEAGKLVVKEKQLDGSEKEKTTTVGQYDADEIIKQAKQMCMTVRRCALGVRRGRDRAVA